jgi:hypothetical protein
VVAAVGLDEGGPGLQLRCAGCEDGLEGEEGGEGVMGWILEGCFGRGVRGPFLCCERAWRGHGVGCGGDVRNRC